METTHELRMISRRHYFLKNGRIVPVPHGVHRIRVIGESEDRVNEWPPELLAAVLSDRKHRAETVETPLNEV